MSDENWNNNRVQFPRLLAEINAVGLTVVQEAGICESMDLDAEHVRELFQRAEDVFEELKDNIGRKCPPAEKTLYDIGVHEGWDEMTMLKLCLDYIDSQQQQCGFLDYLLSRRSDDAL